MQNSLAFFPRVFPTPLPQPQQVMTRKRTTIETGCVYRRGDWSLSPGRGLLDSVTIGMGHGQRGLGKAQVSLGVMPMPHLESCKVRRLCGASHNSREGGRTGAEPTYNDA